MAQKTSLSVTATPGRRYTFIAGSIYQVSVTDGIKQSDLTSNIATLIGIINEGLKQSDNSGNIANLLNTLIDGVKQSDGAIANASMSVTTTDGLTLTDSSVMSLLLSLLISDDINLSDITSHIDAAGNVTVTFVIKNSIIEFNIIKSNVSFDI